MSNQPVNVKFADTYVGCNTLANIMGLHEETVRKRAKRGRIPGTLSNKKWVFKHSELVAAGVQPFASHPNGPTLSVPGAQPVSPVPPIARVNQTDVIFVLDRSGSMSHLLPQAKRNLDEQVNTLRKSAGPNDQYRVTVITFSGDVMTTLSRADVTRLGTPSVFYTGSSGMTALNRAVKVAAEFAKSIDVGQAFLVSIITDGLENASGDGCPPPAALVGELVSTGRYTFAYAGPPGSQGYAFGIGIQGGNVTTWEGTVEGTQTLGRTSVASFSDYTRSRSVGTMSVNSFYAQPVVANPQDFAGKLSRQLTKLGPNDFRVERVMDADPIVIRKFCEAKLGGFRKGKIYYQLTESEKVQDYKGIVIQDTATGAFYAGWEAAASLLGIPKFSGTVRIRPGSLGEFKVFIQSTSVNRKLRPGTAVVCLP